MATKTAIRPETPASKPWPSEAVSAPQGWVVDRNLLPTSIRFAKTRAGLDCTVSDYGSTVHWRVRGDLAGVPIMAYGQESNREIAVAVTEEAADTLRLRGVIPSHAARSTSN